MAIQRYDTISQYFHWLMAGLVLTMLVLGFSLDLVPDEWRKMVMTTHKATGVLILGLGTLRLVWRTVKPAPAELPMPWIQVQLAKLTHTLMYALMILMPLTGLMMASAVGRPVNFYGLFEIQPLLPESELMDILATLHGWMAYTFLALISLHTLAVFYHSVIRRDGTLKRMID